MDIIVNIGQLLLGIGTVMISSYLLFEQFRARRVSNYELMIKSFNKINELGLNNSDNLKSLSAVLYPTYVNDLSKLRERLFIYNILNTLEFTYLSKEYRGVNKEMADNIVSDFLNVLLNNSQTIDILNTGTYSKDFTKFAETLNKNS